MSCRRPMSRALGLCHRDGQLKVYLIPIFVSIFILQIFADNAGTRVVFIDDKADAFVYNPVNDHCVDVPSLSAATQVGHAFANERNIDLMIYNIDFIPEQISKCFYVTSPSCGIFWDNNGKIKMSRLVDTIFCLSSHQLLKNYQHSKGDSIHLILTCLRP